MTTFSVDSNIVSALWDETDSLNMRARRFLDYARNCGDLVICGPVYAEVLAHPSRSMDKIDAFLGSTGIRVDWEVSEAIWRAAGLAFQSYVRRRVEQTGIWPRRIMADFFIGAHSFANGYTLTTLDERIYAVSFPGILLQSL
jgi:hypothetical protein